MDYIIQTDENAKHMIYTMGRHIIMRRLQAESVSLPRLLAGDYSSSLCAVFFNHSIYYAYITVNNSFCVRCTSSSAPLLLLESEDEKMPGPADILKSKEYTQQEFNNVPKNNSRAHAELIDEPENRNHSQSELIKELENKNQSQSELIEELENKNQSQSELIEELENKNTTQTELITKLQEDKDNLQQACNLMMNKISTLLEENESNKKALSIRDSQIESAKSQYNDLMIVAEKYRNEAAKWRNMVIS